jgi:hypothetical protein
MYVREKYPMIHEVRAVFNLKRKGKRAMLCVFY